MSDLRSVPDRVLKLYLYSLGAWAIGLLVLFVADRTIWAITLCFPLAIWLGLLSAWWFRDVNARFVQGGLDRSELQDGAKSVGHILVGGALAPAIVFLAEDPLAPSAWGTCGSIGILAGIGWMAVNALCRLEHRWSAALAVLVAWIVLPINATGALSIGFWFGWFDTVASRTGVTLP